MPSTCCVPGCSQRGRHIFPSEKKQRNAWLVAIKRDNWKPNKTSVVCRAHFTDADYYEKNSFGDRPSKKTLRENVVPSVFTWSLVFSRSSRLQRRQSRREILSATITSSESEPVDIVSEVTITSGSEPVDIGSEVTITSESEPVDIESGVTLASELSTEEETCNPDSAFLSAHTQTDPTSAESKFSCKKFENDPKGLHNFTGLKDYEIFKCVLNTLGPAAYSLNYFHTENVSLSVEDQFFLVMIKLRMKPTHFMLSHLFGISEFTVANVFITWINFMYCQWNEMNWLPDRDLVRFYAPTDIRDKFPSTRLIVDGTEIPIVKPKAPLAQQATFSSRKNRNTVKVLVGITPGGLVSYVSPALGGSVSDRQIVERSNLFTLCDPKDSIIVGQGLNVKDLFAPHDITINIFKKKNRSTVGNVSSDRKNSSKCIHIERVIRLAKTYRMLTLPLNHTETKLASEIIFVCFILCNFRESIVSGDA